MELGAMAMSSLQIKSYDSKLMTIKSSNNDH